MDGFIQQHADIALGDITRQLVREWVADLNATMAPASVQKTVGVLRQVLAMAVAENRLVVNPVDGVELPAVPTMEQRFLTLGAVARTGGRGRGASAFGVLARDVRAAVR